MTTTEQSINDLGVRAPVVIDAIPWITIEREWGNTQYKILRASARENCYTVRIRWPAGIQVPKHRHFGPVHAFTHKGRWHYAEYDWFATPGSYVMEWPETEHSLVVDEDMEALFIVSGGQVDLGPDGQVLLYQDAQRAFDGYRMLLEAQGLEVPAGILVH